MNAQLESSCQREDRRSQRLSEPNCHLVCPETFCDLAVSSRHLERLDDPEAGLRGLIDRETGEQFWAECDELFQFQAFT